MNPSDQPDPRELASTARLFYDRGWMMGTAGTSPCASKTAPS